MSESILPALMPKNKRGLPNCRQGSHECQSGWLRIATGNKKQLVELPADAPVNRVIAILVDKMNLPRHSPDGQLMSYKFHHKASGRQLLDNMTLAAADIRNGDILRLQPEITAGGGAL